MGFVVVLLVYLLKFHPVKSGEHEKSEGEVNANKGKEDCYLNVHTAFPYVVKIWDTEKKRTGMHGAIFGKLAVLTVCDKHLRLGNPSSYEVVAQRILSLDDMYQNMCSQQRKVTQIIAHPSCTTSPAVNCIGHAAIPTCFVVMVINSAFNIVKNENVDTAYPTFYFPISPVDLLFKVRFVNAEPQNRCQVPLFFERNIKKPALYAPSISHDFVSIPYHDKCINLLCEHEESTDWPSHEWERRRRRDVELKRPKRGQTRYTYDASESEQIECRIKYQEVESNAVRICVFPNWTRRLEPFETFAEGETNYYGGATLVCNGTVIGLVRAEKGHMHRVNDQNYRQDFLVVSSFLRAWAWFVEMKDFFTAPHIVPRHIDKLGMVEGTRIPLPKIEGPLPLYKFSQATVLQVHIVIKCVQFLSFLLN
ncbi:hypothetical protein GE061_009223 [Apolygus lucorum]|uniref:Uncharacterized protein n=1 Tax=Apolygus lucorum TaxID=248454 RepID=A0A6A4KFH9_APOLU|nr:hypothetical protein GE061_009223 [Apolygus lucorum]